MCNLKQMTAGCLRVVTFDPVTPLSTICCHITAALTSWLVQITFNCRVVQLLRDLQLTRPDTFACQTVTPLLHPPLRAPPLLFLYPLIFCVFAFKINFSLCSSLSLQLSLIAHRHFFTFTEVSIGLFSFTATSHGSCSSVRIKQMRVTGTCTINNHNTRIHSVGILNKRIR